MYGPEPGQRTPGERAGDDDRRRPIYLVVVVAVAALAAVGVGAIGVLLASDDGGDDTSAVTTPQDGSTGEGSTTECAPDADVGTGACGLTPEELREIHLGYADRLAFTGDRAAAGQIAERARTALAPLAEAEPTPSGEQVEAALRPVSPNVVASTTEASPPATVLAIAVEGGCVIGVVQGGTVVVDVGGFVRDGGCLASGP